MAASTLEIFAILEKSILFGVGCQREVPECHEAV